MSYSIEFEDCNIKRRETRTGEMMARRLALMLVGTDEHVELIGSGSGPDSWHLDDENNYWLHGDGDHKYRFNRRHFGSAAVEQMYCIMLQKHADAMLDARTSARASTSG